MRLEHSLQGRRSVADAHSHRTMGRHHNLRGRLRRDSCRPLLRDPAEKSAEKSAKNSAIFCEKIEIRELSSELRLLMSFSWLCFPGVIWTRFFSPHGFPGFWDSIPKRCTLEHYGGVLHIRKSEKRKPLYQEIRKKETLVFYSYSIYIRMPPTWS